MPLLIDGWMDAAVDRLTTTGKLKAKALTPTYLYIYVCLNVNCHLLSSCSFVTDATVYSIKKKQKVVYLCVQNAQQSNEIRCDLSFYRYTLDKTNKRA